MFNQQKTTEMGIPRNTQHTQADTNTETDREQKFTIEIVVACLAVSSEPIHLHRWALGEVHEVCALKRAEDRNGNM